MSRAGPNRSEAVADSRFPASFPRAPRKDQTGPRGPHAALIVVLVVAVAGVLTMFAEVALGVVVALLLPSVPSHGGGRREKDRPEPEPQGGHLAHPFAARIPSARHRLEPCDP